LARGFAARGHDLFIVARTAEQLRAAADATEAEFGVTVGYAACDLTAPGAVDSILATLAEAGLYVDILVNCAGIAVAGDFIANNARQARATLDLNVKVTTELMYACLPGMVTRGRGGVLNVASLAGMMPVPFCALYGATKSYLIALSRAVATEMAGSGVNVSVLAPGFVDTDFFARNMEADHHSTALLPALSAKAVAHTAINGFFAGQTVITPGILGSLCRLGTMLLPYRLLAPFVGRAVRGLSLAASPNERRAQDRVLHQRRTLNRGSTSASRASKPAGVGAANAVSRAP
jgi:hypothetical protein